MHSCSEARPANTPRRPRAFLRFDGHRGFAELAAADPFFSPFFDPWAREGVHFQAGLQAAHNQRNTPGASPRAPLSHGRIGLRTHTERRQAASGAAACTFSHSIASDVEAPVLLALPGPRDTGLEEL